MRSRGLCEILKVPWAPQYVQIALAPVTARMRGSGSVTPRLEAKSPLWQTRWRELKLKTENGLTKSISASLRLYVSMAKTGNASAITLEREPDLRSALTLRNSEKIAPNTPI